MVKPWRERRANTRTGCSCYIFGSEAHKEWTLSLYNAVNGSSYTDPSAITIATLTQVVYMGMHNDVAFLIADEINLYEQQSTYNPNMPLRLLQYTGNIYEKLVMLRRENKYGKRLIRLPVPKLVVFYNGTTDMPDEVELRLSDAFPEDKRSEADITVRVRMVNINAGRSPGVVASCKPLDEYAWLVARIRRNEREADPAAAISGRQSRGGEENAADGIQRDPDHGAVQGGRPRGGPHTGPRRRARCWPRRGRNQARHPHQQADGRGAHQRHREGGHRPGEPGPALYGIWNGVTVN